ncbi:MAG: glycosyltransferase [Clostridia bacterium]
MQNKINIGEFIDSYYPIVDGVTLVVHNYASRMNNDEFTCSVFAPKVAGYDDKFNYQVYRSSSLSVSNGVYVLSTPKLDAKFTKLIKELPLDVIHAHSPVTMGNYGADIAKKRHIPSIISFHTKYYEHIKDMFKNETMAKAALKKLMKIYDKVDYVWPVSKFAGEIMREYGYTGHFDVVDNGTDMTMYNFKEGERDALNEKYGLREDIPLLLFVGQIINYKNIKFSLDAVNILKQRGIKFKYMLIGEGANREEIVEYANTLNLNDCVEFRHKIVDRIELSRLYTRADLFVLPSLYETFSLVQLEAASCGLPSAVLDKTVLAERISDNVNGFICENDLNTFANMMQFAISDKENLKRVGKNAQSYVKTFDAVAKEVMMRYKDIIKEYNNKRDNEK